MVFTFRVLQCGIGAHTATAVACPTLQEIVQEPAPAGALDAILPLVEFVFGTVQAPPPDSIISLVLQPAVAVAAEEATVATRTVDVSDADPAGPTGPV
jgi:hypothetical protein